MAIYSSRNIVEETMKKKSKEDYKKQVEILKALANEARLMIVEKLEGREYTVGDLTKLVELDQSTVSKHLSVLYNAGIVDYRKAGNQVYYRLLTPCVLEIFPCICKVK
jgi:ArsR family transcriptional regulator